MQDITYDDFARLDMRAARIVSVEAIPGKSRIVRGVIDLGGETRSVIIGGAQHYTEQDLVGRTVIALVNLEPKKIAGIESRAMLLAADVNDRPYWLTAGGDVPPGSPVK